MHCDYICPDEEYGNYMNSKSDTHYSKFSTPKKHNPYKTPVRTRQTSQDFSDSHTRAQSSSKKILKDVLEQELSVNSYSKHKRLQILKKNISCSSRQEISKEEILSSNRKNMKKLGNYQLESNPFEDYIEKFKSHLENVQSREFNGFPDLDPEEQIRRYLEYVSSPCRDLKYAAIFSIFLVVFNNPSEHLAGLVLETFLTQLQNWQEEDDEYIESTLFIIGFIGANKQTLAKLSVLAEILVHDETSDMERIHQAAFSCLFNLGIEGTKCLITLALRENAYLKLWILQRLLLTELIQVSVIIPALVQDLLHIPGSVRSSALAALNRLASIVNQSEFLDIFVGFLDKAEDKTSVACVVRHFGLPGERILQTLSKKNCEKDVKVACLRALSLSFSDLGNQVSFLITENSVESDSSLLPGTFWKYKGPTASIFEEKSGSPLLEVNSRDFLAILQRWVKTKTSDSKEKVFPKIPKMSQNLKDSQIFDSDERLRSRFNLLTICSSISDQNKDVRKEAVSLLGQMQVPDDMKVSKYVKIALQDCDSLVRSAAASVASTLCVNSKKTLEILLKLLRDNFPQVRNAACQALKVVGQQSPKKVLPVLLKLMKEGSVNRQVVAESIVGIGSEGLVQVVDLLNKEPVGNLNIRTCIIKALGTVDVKTMNIDFVIESLFKISQENNSILRKTCLTTLNEINRQGRDKLVYLKPGTLLPLYVKYLKDPSKEIRSACLRGIVELGPQGELVLIESFTKDSNFIIRAQAAKGLGLFGYRHFKTLILGLHDSHFYVRKNTDRTLRKHFNVEGVVNEFSSKPMQMQTLKCAIKEVVNLPYKISEGCDKLLRGIIEEFRLAEKYQYE